MDDPLIREILPEIIPDIKKKWDKRSVLEKAGLRVALNNRFPQYTERIMQMLEKTPGSSPPEVPGSPEAQGSARVNEWGQETGGAVEYEMDDEIFSEIMKYAVDLGTQDRPWRPVDISRAIETKFHEKVNPNIVKRWIEEYNLKKQEEVKARPDISPKVVDSLLQKNEEARAKAEENMEKYLKLRERIALAAMVGGPILGLALAWLWVRGVR